MSKIHSLIRALFEKQAPARHDPPFLNAIANDDPEELESARDWVRPEDIPPLLGLYWQLNQWNHKRAIVEILQDQDTPAMRDVMLDFLRVPSAPGDERTELAQAIALTYIHETYDRYRDYYKDRRLLARDVATVLSQHGLKAEAPPRAKPKPVAPPKPTAPPTVDQQLLRAAQTGDLPSLRRALAQGANVNAVLDEGNTRGCSALMLAILNERYDAANLLLDHRADLHYTRPVPHTKNRDRGQTALWWAATKGHLQLTKRLIDLGAQVNLPDHFGSTAAVQAASWGHLPVLQYLAANNANLQARISDRRTGFHLAVTNGHTPVVEFLLEHGADPEDRGSSGYTPLMVAADNNDAAIASLLLARGVKIDARHTGPGIYAALKGWTALTFAVNGSHARLTRLLLQAGADPNLRMPATRGPRGEPRPPRRMLEFVKGKRGEAIARILRDFGAE